MPDLDLDRAMAIARSDPGLTDQERVELLREFHFVSPENMSPYARSRWELAAKLYRDATGRALPMQNSLNPQVTA